MATGGYEIADVINRALDLIGWPEMVGDPQEGTHQAQVSLRAYRLCRQQLLRAAHWDFARKQAPMLLLADATGNTENVGTTVPFNWTYAYAYPNDCMKMRFIPWNWENQSAQVPPTNTQISTTIPLVGGLGYMPPGARMVPAKFIVGSDFNNLPPPGSDYTSLQGVSPISRVVVLTNVRYAQGVYTCDQLYPTVWDPLFRSAMESYIASEIAVPIWAKKDLKTGLAMRDTQIPILRDKITQARAINGNEGTSSSDLAVDWMNVRRSGGPYGNWGWGNGGGWGGGGFGLDGVLGYGWDSLMVSSGASF